MCVSGLLLFVTNSNDVRNNMEKYKYNNAIVLLKKRSYFQNVGEAVHEPTALHLGNLLWRKAVVWPEVETSTNTLLTLVKNCGAQQC